MREKDLFMKENNQGDEDKQPWLAGYLEVMAQRWEEREQYYLFPMIWRAVLKFLRIKD